MEEELNHLRKKLSFPKVHKVIIFFHYNNLIKDNESICHKNEDTRHFQIDTSR